MAWNLGWPVDSVLSTASRGLGVSADTIATLEKACRQSVVVTFRGDEPRLRAAWGAPRSFNPVVPVVPGDPRKFPA